MMPRHDVVALRGGPPKMLGIVMRMGLPKPNQGAASIVAGRKLCGLFV